MTKRETATHRLMDAIIGYDRTPARDEIYDRAAAFEYHDFKSRHPSPKRLLVEHLRAAGMHELAARVVNGDFDEEPEEAKAWARSSDGLRTLRDAGLVGDDRRGSAE